jgi:hypothetical protein
MGGEAISSSETSAQRPVRRMSLRTYNDKPHYSVPQAAKVIGVSPMTVLRWINKTGKGRSGAKGIKIDGFRDVMSGRFFVSVDSVHALQERERPLISH